MCPLSLSLSLLSRLIPGSSAGNMPPPPPLQRGTQTHTQWHEAMAKRGHQEKYVLVGERVVVLSISLSPRAHDERLYLPLRIRANSAKNLFASPRHTVTALSLPLSQAQLFSLFLLFTFYFILFFCCLFLNTRVYSIAIHSRTLCQTCGPYIEDQLLIREGAV